MTTASEDAVDVVFEAKLRTNHHTLDMQQLSVKNTSWKAVWGMRVGTIGDYITIHNEGNTYPVGRRGKARPFSLNAVVILTYFVEFAVRAAPITTSSISRSTGSEPLTAGPCTHHSKTLSKSIMKLCDANHNHFSVAAKF